MKRINLLAAVSPAVMVAFANKGATPPAPEPAAAATAKDREAPVLSGVLSIALPERKRTSTGSKTQYPFDSLTAVGQFFGVKNKEKRGMTSVVSSQNKKHKVQATDADGKPLFNMSVLTDAQGNKTEVPNANDPKMTFSKKFEVREVTPEIAEAIKGTDAEGSKVLIVRTI
jgi:hypothetical protein